MSIHRLERLYKLMDEAGIQAVALNPGPNLVYLTGLHFHLSERPTTFLAATGQEPVLILPELEVSKAEKTLINLQISPFGENPAEWVNAFKAAGMALGLEGRAIAVEPNRMRFLEMELLRSGITGAQIISGEKVFSRLRLQKESNEIVAMMRAARIAQDALKALLPLVRPGVSERDLAAELVLQLLRHGSDTLLPFEPIVAAGANSANPHAVPGEYRIKMGDLVLFDWGASYNGYFSDITRTFAVGPADEEFKAIYSLVQQANQAGRDAGKPGMQAGKVDLATRKVIDKGGYGAYFTHRTGHGLGMESHEPPYLYAENELVLAEGMVYTIEPGIYLPGKGGVRIEDNMVVTHDGSQPLTDYPRELTIL